uniref:Helicase-primase helicase subunit n=1 Tax=Acipenser herpesvirus 2 TaxID=3078846 RepID=A0AA96M1T3_9VIRU|nr:helicase-primase helicase subunit [Acipenser herpesvirus 2]
MSQCISANVSDYAEFVQNEWVRGVMAAWFAEKGSMAMILSGDAGCGKSHTLMKLLTQMDRLGLSKCYTVAATTHKAASIMKNADARTYQSALGFNMEMCRANFEEFKKLYLKKYAAVIAKWDRIVLKTIELASSTSDHPCIELSMRCATCYDIVASVLKSTFPRPFFLGRGLLFIDEYGILSELSLQKILFVLSTFRLFDQGYILIFTGSVSQLPSPEMPQIWASMLFKEMISHTYSLFINFRVKDRGYAEAISLFQFNTITKPAVDIFNNKSIGPKAVDTTHDESITRIFNNNKDRDTYNINFVTMMEQRGCKKVTVNALINKVGASDISYGEFFDYLTITVPKIFNKTNKGSHTFFLHGPVLRVPSQTKCVLHKFVKHGQHAIIEEPKGVYFEVEREVVSYKGWEAAYFPFFSIVSINTYSAQGETLPAVIYIPPEKNYMLSSIKASAYVACSRVKTRDSIQISCNSFANRVGTVNFFPSQLLDHKKELEMGYIPK